jgi:hypothetical protein
VGFEPTTSGFGGRSSSAEVRGQEARGGTLGHGHYGFPISAYQGSLLRGSGFTRGAARIRTGVEPLCRRTPSLSVTAPEDSPARPQPGCTFLGVAGSHVESPGVEPGSCVQSIKLRYGDATASVAGYCG